MLIQLNHCIFGYEKRPVVQVEGLALHAGRCTGIFGPNGAGKTTLIRGITGLMPPMTGAIRRAQSLRIGYLPQHRALELHWPMTGLDAASLALSARTTLGGINTQTRQKILNSMTRLNVHDLAHRSFAKLSGGQQQRLLLAGAMAADPQILVLDEPTEGLDIRSQQTLLTILRDMTQQGLCTVIISHEIQGLMFLADNVAWLHPAQSAGQPSHVEILSPAELADKMIHIRQNA